MRGARGRRRGGGGDAWLERTPQPEQGSLDLAKRSRWPGAPQEPSGALPAPRLRCLGPPEPGAAPGDSASWSRLLPPPPSSVPLGRSLPVLGIQLRAWPLKACELPLRVGWDPGSRACLPRPPYVCPFTPVEPTFPAGSTLIPTWAGSQGSRPWVGREPRYGHEAWAGGGECIKVTETAWGPASL